MLFIPAHLERFVDRAHERGADAVVLDLEDSVPLDLKRSAREGLEAAVAKLREHLDVLVRINAGTPDDVAAAVQPGVRALVVPKVATRDTMLQTEALVARREADLALPAGSIRLMAQIEDVHALSALDEIATSTPRLLGMSLGSEDFSVSAGIEPVPQALLLPNQMVAFACRRAGIAPFGFPGSIANFGDLDGLRQQVTLARQLGFVGSFCIHPCQVAILNEAFDVSPAQVRQAQAILRAAQEALLKGLGATVVDGRMVDAPVIARANEVLQRARR